MKTWFIAVDSLLSLLKVIRLKVMKIFQWLLGASCCTCSYWSTCRLLTSGRAVIYSACFKCRKFSGPTIIWYTGLLGMLCLWSVFDTQCLKKSHQTRQSYTQSVCYLWCFCRSWSGCWGETKLPEPPQEVVLLTSRFHHFLYLKGSGRQWDSLTWPSPLQSPVVHNHLLSFADVEAEVNVITPLW